MAEASTVGDGGLRSIEEGILQTFNLRIDNNLDEYVVVILGIVDHHYLLENLPAMIKKDRIRSFNDIEACLRFIQPLSNTNIFLITSGKLGQVNVHELVSKPYRSSGFSFTVGMK